MDEARAFYVHTLGCQAARTRDDFTDVWFYGMQITLQDRPDEVPPASARGSRHFGVTLGRDEFEAVVARLRRARASTGSSRSRPTTRAWPPSRPRPRSPTRAATSSRSRRTATSTRPWRSRRTRTPRPSRTATEAARPCAATVSAGAGRGRTGPTDPREERSASKPVWRKQGERGSPHGAPGRACHRPAAAGQLRARLHGHGAGIGARDVRADQGALHRVGRGARPALDAGHRAGLGHRRVLHAAGLDARARLPGGGQGQAVRADPGDPAPDRPLAARRDATWSRSGRCRSPSTATRCRRTGAPARPPSAAPTSRCTTPAPGWCRPGRSARTR